MVGTEGTVRGVTYGVGLDDGPIPIPFAAVTVNEYNAPFSRPVIVDEVAVVVAEKPVSAVTV